MIKLIMKYTTDMEKALEQSHGMNFAEYERKLSNRMKVERKREKDYEQSKKVVAEATSQVHR
ncbi:hypothetical protein [Oceanobacillus salinisoli]|uniref:hypothetical protein n=1 Tax=Oceanobacillus salinisoli TaxID=2678611 RepID=UPI0012E16931|nr:hypothetical protein [Oceanobacillus salinisoli]